jgi:hypothetical protein
MTIGMSPLKALYGYDSPTFMEIDFWNSRVHMDKEWIQESILRELKDQLPISQNQHKFYADKHRVEHNFEVGA